MRSAAAIICVSFYVQDEKKPQEEVEAAENCRELLDCARRSAATAACERNLR